MQINEERSSKKIFFFIKRIQYVFFFLLYSLYSVNEKKCDLFLTISACINQQFLYIHIFLIKKRKNNHPFIQLPKTTTISIIKNNKNTIIRATPPVYKHHNIYKYSLLFFRTGNYAHSLSLYLYISTPYFACIHALPLQFYNHLSLFSFPKQSAFSRSLYPALCI